MSIISTAAQIERAAHLIQRYRQLQNAIGRLSEAEDVDLLMLKLTYIGHSKGVQNMGDREILISYSGDDVPDMIGKLNILSNEIKTKLAEFGVDALEIV